MSERFQSYDDNERDSMMWGPKENIHLAFLLCSNPHQSIDEVIHRIYSAEDSYYDTETETERVLRKEIERDWDVERYPVLCSFLLSADGAPRIF